MSAKTRHSTRRAFVAGLAAAPVAANPAVAAEIQLPPPSARLDALWAEFVSLGPKIVDARAQAAAAAEAMPAWAKPGPKYITRAGVYGGEISNEPMDVTITPPQVGDFRIVRMSLADARRNYKFAQNWFGAARAKKDYVAELRGLAQLRMQQKAEMQKVGLRELEHARDSLIDRQYDFANAILHLKDDSANAIAAKIIAAAFFDTMDAGPIDRDLLGDLVFALAALQPRLTGQIADDVAALLADRETQV
ncbi:MAG: hypothetical protein CTY36_02925 [Methylocystis sp.]|nr:MAG: hypothetical protein CTY36_02925 [Methylocystis sp.]PPD16942.1 MAG: hypothetical protein CTY30_08000 [Methylocystis sp.]